MKKLIAIAVMLSALPYLHAKWDSVDLSSCPKNSIGILQCNPLKIFNEYPNKTHGLTLDCYPHISEEERVSVGGCKVTTISEYDYDHADFVKDMESLHLTVTSEELEEHEVPTPTHNLLVRSQTEVDFAFEMCRQSNFSKLLAILNLIHVNDPFPKNLQDALLGFLSVSSTKPLFLEGADRGTILEHFKPQWTTYDFTDEDKESIYLSIVDCNDPTLNSRVIIHAKTAGEYNVYFWKATEAGNGELVATLDHKPSDAEIEVYVELYKATLKDSQA